MPARGLFLCHPYALSAEVEERSKLMSRAQNMQETENVLINAIEATKAKKNRKRVNIDTIARV